MNKFWNKVDRSGGDDACWPWQGFTHKGYGRHTANGKKVRAHRYAWELTNGPIPEGMNVCHRCDNPPCCNPAHLFLGSHDENMADKKQKGRAPKGAENVFVKRPEVRSVRRGEENNHTTLTDEQVIAIRQLYKDGTPREVIAEQFGIHKTTVWKIGTNRSWTHISGEPNV